MASTRNVTSRQRSLKCASLIDLQMAPIVPVSLDVRYQENKTYFYSLGGTTKLHPWYTAPRIQTAAWDTNFRSNYRRRRADLTGLERFLQPARRTRSRLARYHSSVLVSCRLQLVACMSHRYVSKGRACPRAFPLAAPAHCFSHCHCATCAAWFTYAAARVVHANWRSRPAPWELVRSRAPSMSEVR